MEKFDYVILGGGISGVVFARLLQLYTNKTFVILEKESTAGGLCRTELHNGNYYDTGGGHFLYSKHKKVYDFIFSHIGESSFNKFTRNTKIDLGGHYIDYPIEENIWQLPLELRAKFLTSLVLAGGKDISNTKEYLCGKETSNVKEYLLNKLGKGICESYLFPYNEKMWGKENFENLSTEWLYKIPNIDLEKIIYSIIHQKADKTNVPSHEYFYYPKKGGFQVIFDSIYKHVKTHVRLNEKTSELRIEDGKLKINKYIAGKIINTVPWTALSNLLDINDLLINIKNTSLVVTYECYHNTEGYQWLYTPDLNLAHHRQFNVNSYAQNNKTKTLMKECNLERFTSERKFVKTYLNRFAYPVPLKGKNEQMKNLLGKCETMNIYGLGRWGTWEHHNSDVCIFNAMELFNRLEEKSI